MNQMLYDCLVFNIYKLYGKETFEITFSTTLLQKCVKDFEDQKIEKLSKDLFLRLKDFYIYIYYIIFNNNNNNNNKVTSILSENVIITFTFTTIMSFSLKSPSLLEVI